MIVASFRDDADALDILTSTFKRIQKHGINVRNIVLHSLQLKQITQLVAETLNCPDDRAHSLAGLLLTKSRGVPFHTVQLLRALHRNKLLTFVVDTTQDDSRGRWEWNDDELNRAHISDDLDDLVKAKIEQLSNESKHVLMLASCVGYRFELGLLAHIAGYTRADTARALLEPLREELLLQLHNTLSLVRLAADIDNSNSTGRALSSSTSNRATRKPNNNVEQHKSNDSKSPPQFVPPPAPIAPQSNTAQSQSSPLSNNSHVISVSNNSSSSSISTPLIASSDLSYQFLHDRVHTVVYKMCDQQMIKQTHLAIGRIMLAAAQSTQQQADQAKAIQSINANSQLGASTQTKLNSIDESIDDTDQHHENVNVNDDDNDHTRRLDLSSTDAEGTSKQSNSSVEMEDIDTVLESKHFVVVNHLNHAIDLIEPNSAECIELVKLNLSAAVRSKSAIAYNAATQYIHTCVKLMQYSNVPDVNIDYDQNNTLKYQNVPRVESASRYESDAHIWLQHYDLSMLIYSELCEIEFLSGRLMYADEVIKICLHNAKSISEQVKLYNTLSYQKLSISDFNAAIDSAKIALELLGITHLHGFTPTSQYSYLYSLTQSSRDEAKQNNQSSSSTTSADNTSQSVGSTSTQLLHNQPTTMSTSSLRVLVPSTATATSPMSSTSTQSSNMVLADPVMIAAPMSPIERSVSETIKQDDANVSNNKDTSNPKHIRSHSNLVNKAANNDSIPMSVSDELTAVSPVSRTISGGSNATNKALAQPILPILQQFPITLFDSAAGETQTVHVVDPLNSLIAQVLSTPLIVQQYNKFRLLLRGRPIGSLIDALPECSDPIKILTAMTYSTIALPCFLSSPSELRLISLLAVNHALENGVCIHHTYTMAMLGVILACDYNEKIKGYELGILALSICKRLKDVSYKPKILMLISIALHHWCKPMIDVIPIINEAYQTGIRTGDLISASYSFIANINTNIWLGCSIDWIIGRVVKYMDDNKQIQANEQSTYYLDGLYMLLSDMNDDSRIDNRLLVGDDPSMFILDGEQQHVIYLAQHLPALFANYMIYKAIALYMFGRPWLALECLYYARTKLVFCVGSIDLVLYNIYQSLCMLSILSKSLQSAFSHSKEELSLYKARTFTPGNTVHTRPYKGTLYNIPAELLMPQQFANSTASTETNNRLHNGKSSNNNTPPPPPPHNDYSHTTASQCNDQYHSSHPHHHDYTTTTSTKQDMYSFLCVCILSTNYILRHSIDSQYHNIYAIHRESYNSLAL